MRGILHSFGLAIGLAAVVAGGSRLHAAYTANFNTTGSATDFISFEPNNVDDSTITVESGGGNPYLRLTASPVSVTSSQLRFQAAPANVDGAEVAIPTGIVGDPTRTEARLTVSIREILGGDDLPAENPFVQFGFSKINVDTNTASYAPKVIVQINNALDTISLGRTITGTGVTGLANFAFPGSGAFTPGDTIELQLTNNQARVMLNGAALNSGGAEYFNLPADFFSANFAANEALIPFFGMIRGASALEPEDVVGAGFDNIVTQNVTLGGGVVGDANNDGQVNFLDAQLIASKFLEGVNLGTMGDLNLDAKVDFADFRIWKDASGSALSFAEVMSSVVPEPSAAALGVVGALALVRRRRK